MQQQSEGPGSADIAQLQRSVRSIEDNLQQMQAAQTAAGDRWQTVQTAVLRLDTNGNLVRELHKHHLTPPHEHLESVAAHTA